MPLSDGVLCDMAQRPCELASAKSGEVSESQELSKQRSQVPEQTHLSPEACSFIPGRVEHGCGGAVRVLSEQGQLDEGQWGLVSKYLPSGAQFQTYEQMIVLS